MIKLLLAAGLCLGCIHSPSTEPLPLPPPVCDPKDTREVGRVAECVEWGFKSLPCQRPLV